MTQGFTSSKDSTNELMAMLKTSGAKDATGSLESQFTVVKRDGTLVPFKRERIFRALEAAFRDTKKMPKPEILPEDVLEACGNVADQVIEQAFTLSRKGVCLNVEGIQDLVEVTLMKNGHHDVARDYIIYRDKHKEVRQDSPRHMKIVRRDETTPVRFNPMKISKTLEMAFRRVHKVDGASPQLVIDAVNFLTQKVVGAAQSFSKSGHQLHVQHIQDMIEEELMREGYFNVAKDFILNRAEKDQAPAPAPAVEIKEKPKKKKGDPLKETISHACRNLKEVSADEIHALATANFYDGIKEHEVDSALIMAARSQVEKEPAYATVAARLLLDKCYRETLGVSSTDSKLEKNVPLLF